MSLPIVRQQNAAEIRMPIENHTEEIECLPLVPVRCSPNACDTRHVSVFLIQQHL